MDGHLKDNHLEYKEKNIDRLIEEALPTEDSSLDIKTKRIIKD